MTSVLIVFGVTVALLAGFVLWTASEVDQDALDRQSQQVAHSVRDQLETVPHDQQSVTIWDDMLRAIDRQDNDWLDNNVGIWMHDYYGHDESYIVLAGDRSVYAATGGKRRDPGAFAARSAQLLPFIEEVRELARAGYLDTPPAVSDFALVDGKPAIVSISPIVSDTGRIEAVPGTEPVLATISMLDLEYEMRLIEKYLVEVGRFTASPHGSAYGVFPVTNRSGRIVTFYEWEPYKPGATLMQRTAPALSAGLVVMGGLVAMLLYGLWRSSSALEIKSAEAERQATVDTLTELPNRLSFDRQFDTRLAAIKLRDPPTALLMLDLDRFKQVNDTLGHHAGDELIRAVADRLKAVIGPTDVLARLGGDEFAILHSCYAGTVEVAALAQRIIDTVAKPFRIRGTDAFVGVSIGIVVATAGHRDSLELSRQADIALYEAKSAGRNRAAFYEAAMDEDVQDRHTIEAELREALRTPGQLWVAFQPLCDGEAEVVGAEALLRWTHPQLGAIAPARFVAVAESTGLIEQLGEFVLRRAAEFGARWPGRSIAVNISPAQLRNPTFAERVFELLAETGMRPADLEMEITESILLDDESTATETIRSLRARGIRVALDDFGTGYSSLSYLKRYPVDRIKIDRSFVAQLSTASASDAIVQAMVTLAHALDIEVTAEGVETDEQFRSLVDMGCNTFQGYLFSAPLAVSDINARFSAPLPQVA